MRILLLVLVCLLALPTTLLAAETVADADCGVMYTQERVSLPQDQGKWYVSVFGDPTDSQFQKLQQWFKSNAGLTSLRGQVHYNVYASNTLRFKRYAKDMPGLPCVRVQNSRGEMASEFWAEHIPWSAASLYNGICKDLQEETSCIGLRAWREKLRKRRCPGPHPGPNPEPVPEPEPEPPADDPPVLEPEPEPASGLVWLLYVAAVCLGGGIGVAQGWKSERKLNAPGGSAAKL